MRTPPLSVENKISTVEKLYGILPDVGVETNTNVIDVGKNLSISPHQMDKIIRDLENRNILKRRLSWEGGRKASYWTLLIPKEDAINVLTRSNLPEPVSLKARIFKAMSDNEHYQTVYDILLAIRKPTENIDLHSMTNNLYALQQEGKITFKVDGSGRRHAGKGGNRSDNLPFDINLRKHVTTQEIVAAHEAKKEAAFSEEEVKKFARRGTMADGSPNTLQGTPSEPIMVGPDLPLIQKFVHRRELLEQAAKLAEDAGEDDVAITLMEKTQKTLTPFESEVMQLWAAYQECKYQ